MKLLLCGIFSMLVLSGCTSNEVAVTEVPASTATEVRDSHDTRVTAAHTAAHCLNNITARAEITEKNWKKSFKKECGSQAANYMNNPQFKEFLSEKSNRVVKSTLAE